MSLKPKAIIVDLDGTLCDIKHRLHFISGDKKDWETFQKHCILDKPNQWCISLIRAMELHGVAILLFSGRMDFVRNETEVWLEHHGVSYQTLKMRKSGDYRKDSEVKLEMLADYKNRFEILFVVDDRKQVVDMWREQGLVCLQCQEGDY